MNGQLYIDLAKSLIKKSDQEEYIRCAISRYYYGLLHTSIEKLIELDPENKDLKDKLTLYTPIEYQGSIHTSTISGVKAYNGSTGGNLDIVKELRVISDYHFEKSILNYPLEIIKNGEYIIMKFNNIEEVYSFLDKTFTDISKLKPNAKSNVGPLTNKIPGLENIMKKLNHSSSI